MASDESLLVRLQLGSENAATQIYLRYAARLHALVRARCSPDLARLVDAEDIVQSVFRSFFQAAGDGKVRVATGEDLWNILLVIALNKIRNSQAFHRAAKRDARITSGSDFLDRQSAKGEEAQQVAFLETVVAEALESLPAAHRQVVELRLQGYQVAEVATQIGRSKRSAERLLQEARDRLGALLQCG